MEVDTLSRKARNGDAESIIWELRREISALKSAAEDNQTELWKHQQFAERGRMEVEQLQLRLETETAARRTAEQGMLRLEVQIREIRTLATSVVALWGPQFDGTAPWTGDRAIASREAILALNAKLEDLESNLGLLQLATPKARGAKTAEALLSEGSPGLVELEMPSCLSMPTTPVPSKYGHDGRSLSTATLFDSNAGKVGDSAGRGTSTENTAPELDGRKSELAPTLFSIRDPLIKRTQSIILREFVRRSMDMVDQSPAALAAELAAYEARTKSAPQPLSPPSENKVSKVIDANLDGDTVNPRDARPRGVVEAVIRQSLQLERFPPAVDVQQLQASTMSSDDDDDEEEDDLPGRPSVDYDWDFPESMPPEDGGLISSIKSWWN